MRGGVISGGSRPYSFHCLLVRSRVGCRSAGIQTTLPQSYMIRRRTHPRPGQRHVRGGVLGAVRRTQDGRAERGRRCDGAGSSPKRTRRPRTGRSCKGKRRLCGRCARAGPPRFRGGGLWPAGPGRERWERSQPVSRCRPGACLRRKRGEPGRTTSASVPGAPPAPDPTRAPSSLRARRLRHPVRHRRLAARVRHRMHEPRLHLRPRPPGARPVRSSTGPAPSKCTRTPSIRGRGSSSWTPSSPPAARRPRAAPSSNGSGARWRAAPSWSSWTGSEAAPASRAAPCIPSCASTQRGIGAERTRAPAGPRRAAVVRSAPRDRGSGRPGTSVPRPAADRRPAYRESSPPGTTPAPR